MPDAGIIGRGDLPGTMQLESARELSRSPERRLLILSEIISPYRIPVFNALARIEGVRLHVVFLAETDASLRQWPVYKDEIGFSFEILRSWRVRAGKHNLLLNWGLKPALSRFAPHSVICGGYNYIASWQLLGWARRHRTEFILWSESNSRDARRGRPWVEFLKARFLRRCDGFVVPGRASREYLLSLGQAHKNILTAPNAVDNEWFQARARSVSAEQAEFREKFQLPSRFVLFVGRLVTQKGIFDLLDAYAKLTPDLRSKIGLVFVGDGTSRKDLEVQGRKIDPGVVCFPGFVHREDLVGFYALAEALVLPTHSDTWGLVVNEAMACGLPGIVSNVAGCSADLIEDGWNGYLVPPRNSDKLSEAMYALLENPDLRRQMGARSAERICLYSPEACARGLAEAAVSGTRQVL